MVCQTYINGFFQFQFAVCDGLVGKLDKVDDFKTEVRGCNAEHLGIINLPHTVTFGTARHQRLCARCLDRRDIVFGDLFRFVDHTHRIDRVSTALLVFHKHELGSGGVEYLCRCLCDTGVDIRCGTSGEIDHVCLVGDLDVLREPFFPVFMGCAELVMFCGNVLCDLLVRGHRACAVFYGLDPQGFKCEPYFQVKVTLATDITCPAERIGVDDFEQLVGPFEFSFVDCKAYSHLPESAV